jgi:hypothetical protein
VTGRPASKVLVVPVKFGVNTPAVAFIRDDSVAIDLFDARQAVVVAGPLRFADTPAFGVVIRERA